MAGIQKHTPTPWGASHLKSSSLVHNVPLGEYAVRVEVTGERHKDDAAFIACACNSHEALVKALERAGAHLRKLAYSHGADEDEADEAVAYITAALKAADAES
jgi:hypothetical protein